MGPPRAGTSYAGLAALNELARIDAYSHLQVPTPAAYDMYEDLRAIWDASTYAGGHAGDAAAWAEKDLLAEMVTAAWAEPVFMLNDWSESVPTDFFLKHFY